jgi:PAS domain S-box-containing protein
MDVELTKLLQKNGYCKAILNGLGDQVLVINHDYIVVDVNEPMLHQTGYTRDQVVGLHCYQVNHHLESPCWTHAGHPCPARDIWQTRRPAQAVHVHYDVDGKPIYVQITTSPLVNNSNEVIGFVETGRDVTAEKQLKTELSAVHKLGHELTLLRDEAMIVERVLQTAVTLLQLKTVALALVDEATDKLTHYHTLENGELEIHEAHSLLNREKSIWAAVARSGRALNLPDTSQDPHLHFDDIMTHSALCVPLKVGQRVIGVLNAESSEYNHFSAADERLLQTLADQSAIAVENARLYTALKKQFQDLRQAQVQLSQSEKLAAIGELIAGVAHELNNPLTSITLYSQLLHRKGVNEEILKDVQVIAAQAQRASNIVRSLLDFARQHPPERKLVQVNNVLQSAFDLLAYELRVNNVECIIRLDPDLPLTLADSHQLQQVFVNVINNALQAVSAAHRKGRITAVTQTSPSIYPGHTTPENTIRIIVQDDGPGILPAIQQRIFDPFFTTKAVGEGTGLGLSVCHGIISEHKGNIWLNSQADQGSTFYIELPITVPDSVPMDVPVSFHTETRDTGRIRVLVIDDEDSVRQILNRALQRDGYQVDAVANGETGLECLSSKLYDLILCDIRMPQLDGPDFYCQVRDKYPHLAQKIVFMTGDTLSPSTRLFLNDVNPPYLNKPFELHALDHIVQQILDVTSQ